ncbi:MAG: response regulator [Treponema sp.]|jgi:signal transduction histidine kinase/DNA-binding response OmpR family regulator|nr:response regulator [Treponema sp.]
MNDVRVKLMVIALAACIAVLGLAAVSRAVFTGEILTNQSLGRVEYSGSLAASRLNGWLENQIGYLNGVAEDFRWILESYGSEELRPVIENHYKNYSSSFFQMYFGYPDGSLWFAGDWQPEEGWRADKREWFAGAARDPQGVFISNPYRDARTGSACVSISKAILRNGELLAVVGADVSLNDIQRMVNETPIAGGQGFAFLAAEDSGIILVHPNADYMPREDGQYRTLGNSFGGVYGELLRAADGESVFIAGADGTRRYCSIQTIPSAGWKFFSLVDQDTIQGPIKKQTRLEIFLFALILVLICVLLLVTSGAMSRAARTAKEHSDMKTAFLANMSHEIRTPMNGIIGFTELALEDMEPPGGKTREYLEKIRSSAAGLLSILNDILDISKIEAGKVTLEKLPFDLHDLIAACENTISLRAAEKGIGLYIYSEPFIEYKLLGDPTKLRQVLINLLANAVKFTNVGTVKLMITVEDSRPGKIALRFEVKDSGIGITADQMANIFKPFEQADRSTTRKYGGTGLGLPISKNLVELMGGRLNVESAPGIGSKFSFILEFDLSDKKTGRGPQEPDSPAAVRRPALSGRILVCEDNTMNQEVIRDHLRRLGLETDIRENGQLGVEAVRESMQEGRPYSLIFMDIHMPVMDGLEASSEIKRLGCTSPIVALTANVLTRDTDIYYRYGIVDHLGKPFSARNLWDCLSRHLNPAQAEGSPETAGPEGAPDLPGDVIDYQAGLNTTEGNRELYEKLRRDFYTQNRNFFEEFRRLLGEAASKAAPGAPVESLATAHRMVHSLKSSAALIGAEKLKSAAAEVEAPLKEGRFTGEQVDRLQKALEAVLAALEKEQAEKE